MKSFRWQQNIGKARHVISYHDGLKTNPDKSPFYDIRIFSRKRDAIKFADQLETSGYSRS